MITFDYSKTPITQIADYIIIQAAKASASDIHFDPREKGLMVRMRIDGDLQDYTFIPEAYERNLTTRLKLLSNMNITENRLPQDGAIKGVFGGQYLDMRVSCLPTNEGEKIVIRILDYTRSLQGIEHLGFNSRNLVKLKRMMGVPNGIILITGATGSGKSTTVYSILQVLNKEETNIITVEDPIEMNIEGMNQVQVNSEIGMTFATVLRSILRQDPNIILIGEIRDSETAKIAVRASITGHLVLSTIHTNNSLSTIERLLDMDVERYLLSSAITGIISQRLVKKVCEKCKTTRKATLYEQKIFKNVLDKDVDEICEANQNGCPSCNHGYRGRIAIQEVLEIDEDIRLALNNSNLRKEDLKQLVYGNKNVITLLQDALLKVLDGITTFEEVYRSIEIDSDVDEDYGADHREANKEIMAQKNNVEETTTEEKQTATTQNNNINPSINQNVEKTLNNTSTVVAQNQTPSIETKQNNNTTIPTNQNNTVVVPQIPKPIPQQQAAPTIKQQTVQTNSMPIPQIVPPAQQAQPINTTIANQATAKIQATPQVQNQVQQQTQPIVIPQAVQPSITNLNQPLK